MAFDNLLRKAGVVIYPVMTVGLMSIHVPAFEYADMPSEDYRMGGTKNGIAAVVAGVVGAEVYGDSNIDLKVNRSFSIDSDLTGRTTPSSIDVAVTLNSSSTVFKADLDGEGALAGYVDKSERDWIVRQIGEGKYDIFNVEDDVHEVLQITAKDGKISGTYTRSGPHFDWDVSGTYDEEGNVSIEIDGPMNLGITLEGTIR